MPGYSAYPWLIDRWRKSGAYLEMTSREQGMYRNLIDEAVLRDGVIPNDERLLSRACGDPLEWPDARDKVLRWFTPTLDGKGLENEVVTEIVAALEQTGLQKAIEKALDFTRKLRGKPRLNPSKIGEIFGAAPPLTTPLSSSSLKSKRSINSSNDGNSIDIEACKLLIDSYNEIVQPPRGIGYTPGNIKAAVRFYAEGYTLDQARTVFSAVKAKTTATARWCAANNREFEYLVRPAYKHYRTHELVQGPLDKIHNELATGRKHDGSEV